MVTTEPIPVYNCRCGVKKSSRIVGGTTVNDPINKYPWIVSIQRTSDSSHICGGSLVASKYVVTSARCLYRDTNPYTESDIQVRIGDYDLSVVGETSIAEKTLGVAAIRRHENFIIVGDNGNSDWDVAVLELSEHLDLETVTPSCLARTSDRTSFDGKPAQAYGWGATVSSGSYSDKLHEVTLPVLTNNECREIEPELFEDQICAGGRDGFGTCIGDAGGALTVETQGGQQVLVGVTSYNSDRDQCASVQIDNK